MIRSLPDSSVLVRLGSKSSMIGVFLIFTYSSNGSVKTLSFERVSLDDWFATPDKIIILGALLPMCNPVKSCGAKQTFYRNKSLWLFFFHVFSKFQVFLRWALSSFFDQCLNTNFYLNKILPFKCPPPPKSIVNAKDAAFASPRLKTCCSHLSLARLLTFHQKYFSRFL